MARLFGAGQMAQNQIQRDRRHEAGFSRQARQIARVQAEPSHAGIDLDIGRAGRTGGCAMSGSVLQLIEAVEDRHKRVFGESRFLARERAVEDMDMDIA